MENVLNSELCKIIIEFIIKDIKKGCKSTTRTSSRISDSISVLKLLKLSSILFWKSEEEGEIQRNLIKWRLGRVAFIKNVFTLLLFK